MTRARLRRRGLSTAPRPADLACRAGGSGGRGFTIVEMMVAVGAVALIAVGLARIFAATGETVRAGRGVSVLNEYAAMIERQMREDFGAMTREGFLVIRHREVPGVALSAEDPAAVGPRRVDQIVFFANGRFASLRDPTIPEVGVPDVIPRTATGTAARIYYGHGLRQVPGSPSYYAPTLDDPNNAPRFGTAGPNRFAADWTLLRHVTVLTKPQATAHLASYPDKYADNAIQIGGQPAAGSVFRELAEAARLNLPAANLVFRESDTAPQFASGIVDVAATDLQEVRAWAMEGRDPGNLPGNPKPPRPEMKFTPGANARDAMQEWMREAFPADLEQDPANPEPERRMRYEPAPPDLFGAKASSAGAFHAKEFLRTDQMMLTASNFVPGCTEFIVEWTFGVTYGSNHPQRAGELIWHGLERSEDLDGDGRVESHELVAAPYEKRTSGDDADAYGLVSSTGGVWPTDWKLIHGDGTQGVSDLQYAYFGFVDPTYTAGTLAGVDSVPWPWPRLIRVTMRLVDPSDSTLEHTYQFIFDVPQNSRDGV